jgi:mono/diheme cytochrome c family protein
MEKLKGKLVPTLLIGVLVGGVMIVINNNTSGKSQYSVQVSVPQFSTVAAEGRDLFNANCSACHGENASGTENGPPLIHNYYKPNHHGDGAFLNAAMKGVRAHHWQFGNMPPVEGMTAPKVLKIVRYVRELQRANGIM